MRQEQNTDTLIDIATVQAGIGDKGAFRILFTKHYQALYEQALFVVGDKGLADEAVSDVFVNIWKSRERLGGVENWGAYLSVAVRRQSVRLASREAGKLGVLSSLETTGNLYAVTREGPESQLLSDELFDVVAKSVKRMPLKRAIVFRMVKEEGLTYKETAEKLEISVKTVELHVGLALRDVRKDVEDYLSNSDMRVSDQQLEVLLLLAISSVVQGNIF
ncbi:hypothetical protein FUAX_00130 [Fulvitalea axinellae]|uniref:RNA polymerase sigma-70 factor n=1 Tax=Fulvitalea axinellae TaxID=1182444 RepID=A0AAU9C6D7_9BACT|nr:hypothetical protein FUAX_00130 [Fulvitalea axinellae]